MEQEPYMVIGSADPKYSDDDLFAHHVAGSLHWELNLIGFSIGNSTNYEKSKVRPKVNRIMTDTGTWKFIVP